MSQFGLLVRFLGFLNYIIHIRIQNFLASFIYFFVVLFMGKSNRKNGTLKVLHLIHQPQQRGAEIFACQLANHQRKLGVKVEIVAVFSGNAELPWKDGIQSLNGNKSGRFWDFGAWKRLHKIITRLQPDIVQANAGDTLKYAVSSKKVFGWKSSIVFRNASEVGRYLDSRFQRGYNKVLFQNVERVISVSQASKQDLIDHFPFLKNKTEVLPVGLEKEEDISPVSLKPECKEHIVHVGGYSFEKNHSGLISIFERLLDRKRNVHLHLIGDGPLRPEIEDLVKEKGFIEHVHFYGFVNNPMSYIKGGDILVLPSIIEGLPGVLLEAMYCSVPVVAYNVGGISEIIRPDTGLLIEKGNEEAFAEAIVEVLQRPNHSRIINANQMVRKKFMNEEVALKFVNSYRKLVEGEE